MDVFPLHVGRAATGQLPLTDQQFRNVIGGLAEVEPFPGEFGDDRPQQRVVLAVLPPGEEMGNEHAQRPQVGQVSHAAPGLEDEHLVDLAGHDDVRHAVPPEVADRGAESGDPAPLEVVAKLGQLRVGVSYDAQAIDLMPLSPQSLDDQHGIAAPTGHEPDAAGRERGRGIGDWGLEIRDLRFEI